MSLFEPPKPGIEIDPGVDTSTLPYGRIGAVVLLVLLVALAWNKAPRVLLVFGGLAGLLLIGATR